MEKKLLKDWFGLENKVNFRNHVFAFFIALLLSYFFAEILSLIFYVPLFRALLPETWYELQAQADHFSSRVNFPPPSFWLNSIISAVTMALVFFTVLKKTKNDFVGILLISISFLILNKLFLKGIPSMLASFWMHRFMFIDILGYIILFSCGIYLLKEFKYSLVALFIGFIVGNLTAGSIDLLNNYIYLKEVPEKNLPFFFLQFLFIVKWMIRWLIFIIFWIVGLKLLKKKETLPEIKKKYRIYKPFYVRSYIIGGGYVLFLYILSFTFEFVNFEQKEAIIEGSAPFLGLGTITVIFFIGLMWSLIYKMGEAIKEPEVCTTPRYWIFHVFLGFVSNYNKYISKHNITANKLNGDIFIFIIILSLLSLIPYLNVLTMIILYILWIIAITKICDAINVIPLEREMA